MSVDFSPYVNLRIYDREPGELYLSALELLQLNVPQLRVRAGTIEDGLVQAFSYLTTIAVNHINTLPNKLAEGIMSFMGVERRVGSFAKVSLEFEALSYEGGTLEVGTTLEHRYTLGNQTYRSYYELIEPVVIEAIEPDPLANPPTPLPKATGRAFATEQGIRQLVEEGATLYILNSQQVADTATALGDFEQGSEEESDSEYLGRSGTYLRSLSSTLANATQMESFVVSSFGFVDRVKAYDLTNAENDRSEGALPAPGYVSVFVYGKDRPLGLQEKNEIYETLYGKTLAGLSVSVLDMDIVDVTLEATVKCEQTAEIYVVEGAIQRQLQAYLSPSQFPYTSPGIRKSALISEINKVPGVAYVSDIDFGAVGATVVGDDIIFDDKGVLPSLPVTNLTLNIGYA